MNNNKQSSVEWLIKQLIFKTEFEDLPNQYVLMSDKDIDSIIDKAKAMHKEEICKSYVYGSAYGIDISNGLNPDIYYNETYGGEQ
jgi:hypothetical protein